MSEPKNFLIKYNGNQITMFSDELNDYINLTEMAKAWRERKSILTWLRNTQTIAFLDAWEKKYNPKYNGAQIDTVLKLVKERTLSIKQWIELTNAKGIFTQMADIAGTYAHKDIAIRFGGWLSPEFELYLVDEIQRLKELEKKKDSYELLTHEQILDLVRLKEIFKYVAHQEIVEKANKEVFAAKSGSKNPFAEFNVWRNEMLDLTPEKIEERIKEYCEANRIPLTKKILSKSKREKILFYDSYESVRNAVWDFLSIKGEVNALNLANLVSGMMRIEKGEVLRQNETDLFHTKQDLREFNDFEKSIMEMPLVKTAREILALREAQKEKQKLS